MAIGDVRPSDPSDQPKDLTLSDTTPATQGHDQDHEKNQDEHNDQFQEESNNQVGGWGWWDKEESNSTATPPHPRVHHTVQRDHPMNNILIDIKKGVITKSRVANFCEHYSFISSFEPLKVEDALRDLNWVVAIQEELNNFKRNKVWSLVERPKLNIAGTKRVFRNK
jgi:hypothetical protein